MKFLDNIMKNKKILSNNPLLYATAIVSFLNILGFIQIGKIDIVLLYITIAILLSVYSKNMVIVLGLSLLISNLVSYMGYNMKMEGMEGMEEDDEDMEDDENDMEEDDEDMEEDDDEYDMEEDDEEPDLDANLDELNDKLSALESMVS